MNVGKNKKEVRKCSRDSRIEIFTAEIDSCKQLAPYPNPGGWKFLGHTYYS